MTLEQDLLAAHADGDKYRLTELYERAADTADTEAAKYFFMTQAYVFALDCGHEKASELAERLRSARRL